MPICEWGCVSWEEKGMADRQVLVKEHEDIGARYGLRTLRSKLVQVWANIFTLFCEAGGLLARQDS